tara:strand:- start:4240 stop:4614 length:375 start_codon:yes stop_codon:yes gene_type:complete
MKIQYIKIRKRTQYTYELIEYDHGIYHDYGMLDFKGVVNALLNIMNETRAEFMEYHGDALDSFDRLNINEYKAIRKEMTHAISKHHEARETLTNLEHLEVEKGKLSIENHTYDNTRNLHVYGGE